MQFILCYINIIIVLSRWFWFHYINTIYVTLTHSCEVCQEKLWPARHGMEIQADAHTSTQMTAGKLHLTDHAKSANIQNEAKQSKFIMTNQNKGMWTEMRQNKLNSSGNMAANDEYFGYGWNYELAHLQYTYVYVCEIWKFLIKNN